jgi:hypothetical protein
MGGLQSVVDIETEYNSLQPLSIVGKGIDDTEALKIAIFNFSPHMVDFFNDVHNKWYKIGARNGFNVFLSSRDKPSYLSGKHGFDVYYVPADYNESKTYFLCSEIANDKPGPKCEGRSDFMGNFLLIYLFSYKYINEWKIVDSRVRDFIRQIVY